MDLTRCKVHFGRWLIDGYPNVILFNIAKARDRLDEWRKVRAYVSMNERAFSHAYQDLYDNTHIGCPYEDEVGLVSLDIPQCRSLF